MFPFILNMFLFNILSFFIVLFDFLVNFLVPILANNVFIAYQDIFNFYNFN